MGDKKVHPNGYGNRLELDSAVGFEMYYMLYFLEFLILKYRPCDEKRKLEQAGESVMERDGFSSGVRKSSRRCYWCCGGCRALLSRSDDHPAQ